MTDPIITHAVLDMRTSRSFHVPVDELDRYVGSQPQSSGEWWPPVIDVSGGRPINAPDDVIERWFREACERAEHNPIAPRVYLDVQLSRADLEREFGPAQPQPAPRRTLRQRLRDMGWPWP